MPYGGYSANGYGGDGEGGGSYNQSNNYGGGVGGAGAGGGGGGGGGGGYQGNYGAAYGDGMGGPRYQAEPEMQQYNSAPRRIQGNGGLPSRPGPGGLPTGPRPGGGDRMGGGGAVMGGVGGGAGGGGGGRGGGMNYDEGSSDILGDCRTIDSTISDLESQLQSFRALQSRILSDRAQISELDNASADLMSSYRSLASRMKRIKSNPESSAPRNAPQVGRVDRRLKGAMTDFQKIESEFRAQMREQQARQYRIVNPNATEEEIEEAVEDPTVPVFQQALLNSDRRGQSQSALNAVRARHVAIQNIERTMIEIAELFQDLDTLVLQQDVQVQNIEVKGEEIQENIVKGNEELSTGIKSARAARKKKWICFWLSILILLLIAGGVVAYLLLKNKVNK